MSDPPSPDNSVPSDLLVSIPDLEEDTQDENQKSHDHIDTDELNRLQSLSQSQSLSVPSWNAEVGQNAESGLTGSVSTLSLGSALMAPPDPYLQAHDPADPPSRGRHLGPTTDFVSFLPDSEATQRALTSGGIPESVLRRARESEGTDQPSSSAVLRAAREIGRENRRGRGVSYINQSPSDEGGSSRGRGLQVPGTSDASNAPYTASRSPPPPRLMLTPPVPRRSRSASNSSHGSRVPSPLSRQILPDDIDIDTEGDDVDVEGTEAE
ncbi:hypothetical protein EHS25_007990 [Saitozyma podzolica]|uniref:Uncharacterized protein n=1 Tax=Saitozyma podzolica TaxID=1890683 RepID=A0A427YN95_9TREE|nr:hypothetical protein EHS25_007990 [Saitozyma podzolica]